MRQNFFQTVKVATCQTLDFCRVTTSSLLTCQTHLATCQTLKVGVCLKLFIRQKFVIHFMKYLKQGTTTCQTQATACQTLPTKCYTYEKHDKHLRNFFLRFSKCLSNSDLKCLANCNLQKVSNNLQPQCLTSCNLRKKYLATSNPSKLNQTPT